jgi:hypothetical protein
VRRHGDQTGIKLSEKCARILAAAPAGGGVRALVVAGGDALERALAQSTQEHTAVRNELAERELHTPEPWVQATLGERPDGSRAGEAWDNALRQVARYRVEHEITDPSDALGPRPAQPEQQRDWERAREAIDRAERRLGRDVGTERDVDLRIGL